MSDFPGRLSWLFFNVGVPILAPIALLPLLGFSRFYRLASRGIAMRCVKEGQLLWVVISMCASACHEIGGALSHASSDGTRAMLFAGLLWHGMFIVASSVIVSFGVADSMPDPAYDSEEKARSRRLMWASLLMTALVTTSYCISHFSLT
ncbi:hypothetical protein [Paraburkholderia sp. BL21I4N1]|uniref:hypothetical protein n=1 Tax=Paraburkholderia sp. BL21I4N1 TaxID=1938801 RepID=UPI000CFC024F|nr:hypothetical protein [Paraburkholderia sp. BL21I4N1]PQV45802.1 hypothetical protein B0G83_11540 [Paraburkholderia sp. BL21I4N1]